ncbi:MAG TPA: hypothetical protein VFZ91_00070 [Allosphingosinicella sp.]
MSMPATHELTVKVEAASLAALVDAGAGLYAFLGFQTSNRTAVPLVFVAQPQLAASMPVAWAEDYRGFVSQTLLPDGVGAPGKRTIEIASTSAARLGDALTLSGTLGLDAASGGTPGALTFRSGQPATVTCGLSYGGGDFTPACAATLNPGIDVVLAPLQVAFVMLSSSQFQAGAWVSASAGNGLRVDMTAADARIVTFDMKAPGGWVESGQAWAQPVPAGTPLSNVLRQAPRPNVARMMRR